MDSIFLGKQRDTYCYTASNDISCPNRGAKVSHECFESIYVRTHRDDNNYKLKQFPRSFLLFGRELNKIGKQKPASVMSLLVEVIESRILLPVNLGILSEWLKTYTDQFSQLELILCHKYILKVSFTSADLKTRRYICGIYLKIGW
ncbi:hypothetical protein NC652_036896 [Populus alba x Populus x berolinensis]|nr:hypothetical protein NC652_036896 [Populus alba x Populus x berolinensis]